MSQVFENYGRRAAAPLSWTSRAGRYRCQADGEKRAVLDIVSKLALSPTDALLDIGCGLGNLTIPLSFLSGTTACVDHQSILEELRRRVPLEKLQLIPGSFLDVEVKGTFDKVLTYGVVLCLSNEDEVLRFIDKAAALVAPGGRLLVGDLPNLDLKTRFMNSERGRRFQAEWDAQVGDPETQKELEWAKKNLPAPNATVQFNDAFVARLLERYRGKGFNAWLLPQPPDLAFGNTREDLLIERPQ